MISTKILPDNILRKIKSYPKCYDFLKKTFNYFRQFAPKTSYPGLPGRIHPNDFMLKSYGLSSKAQYLNDSRQQFELIEEALKIANKSWHDVTSFLDLGSGYGRILRWVTTKLPGEAITACDVNKQAVRFCKKEFSCNGIVTNADFSKGEFKKYDVFFSCSVLTHLTEENTIKYLKLIADIANKNAVLAFSIHGKASINKAAEKINSYLDANSIVAALKEAGFYYHPYPHYPGGELGDTFFTIEYLKKVINDYRLPIKILVHKKGPVAGWLHDWVICSVN